MDPRLQLYLACMAASSIDFGQNEAVIPDSRNYPDVADDLGQPSHRDLW